MVLSATLNRPVSQQFSPSDEQPEHHKFAHDL